MYEKMVRWKPSLFQVPSSAEGKKFVGELTDCFFLHLLGILVMGGDMNVNSEECTAAQSKLRLLSNKIPEDNLARWFAKLMMIGKLKFFAIAQWGESWVSEIRRSDRREKN